MASKTKITAASKVRTKGSIYKDIAGLTGLSRKQVVSVFDALTEMMKADLGKKGCGTFNLFGLAKMRTVIKPATKARKGKNPFTGEEIMIKATKKVRFLPAKGLKEVIAGARKLEAAPKPPAPKPVKAAAPKAAKKAPKKAAKKAPKKAAKKAKKGKRR